MNRFLSLVVALSSLGTLSCSNSEPSGIVHGTLVTELSFARRTGEEMGGVEVSPGLNLDDLVSDRLDTAGCNRSDFMSPDGTQGIDNQFTYLFEAIEEVFPNTVEGIIQGTINEGRLLLMFELNGVDDLRNDEDVELRIFLAEGRPDLSADNRIVPNQTFDQRLDSPVSVAQGHIRDGVFEAGPFDVEFPVAVFDVFFDLFLTGARMKAVVNEDGTMDGFFGGGMAATQIVEVAMRADELQGIELTPIINVLLPRWVDLYPDEDGRCTQLSTTMAFHATTAFIFEDAP